MRVRRETERPSGASISYSQLSSAQACGLRLKFHRARVPQKSVSVMLLYGRALHAGIEARSKGRARTDEEAARIAVGVIRSEVAKQKLPVEFDDPWETLKDGSVSADSYGRLPNLEACEYWLRHQVPLYLQRFPDLQVVRSEHRIFVPLTPPSGVTWQRQWSLECWLDREMKDGSVHDLKSANAPWGERDVRKSRIQALIYMAAYYSFYGHRPTYFEFHVLSRLREERKAPFRPAPRVDVHRFEWNLGLIQAYLDSIVKPQIAVIEAEHYVANPGGSLCTSKYCSFFDHCVFGTGKAS
jgi:hypothetical protein